MTDQLKVQVSAFLDNELLDEECELFVRRLCADKELHDTAGRYAMIGDILRGESFLGLQELGERIHSALDESKDGEFKDSDQQKIAFTDRPASGQAAVGLERFLKPISGLAVAATVAMAAIFLIQSPTELGDTELPSTTVAFVDTENGATTLRPVVGLPDIRPVSAAVQTRLDQYLLHHRNYATSYGNRSILGLRDVGRQNAAPEAQKPVTGQDQTGRVQNKEPQQ